ncbi:MAG: hypothetical protein Q7J51_06105 [Sheuella sp.]|nr:hypothetical protein [Sheuella sp.]
MLSNKKARPWMGGLGFYSMVSGKNPENLKTNHYPTDKRHQRHQAPVTS